MPPATANVPGVPRPGETIAGKYRVEGVLGAGGMGVVLAAWDLVLQRRVAIKLLLPEAVALAGAGERFLREARAAAALESNHVARVLDMGRLATGEPYLALEHLTGSDMGDVLKERGSLPIQEAVDLVLEACEALAEAHARGIIHRDLKLKNLFLARRADGSRLVKVLDFGLSKILPRGGDPGDASLTLTQEIVGSIHYMAPEQLRGLKYADARTDIWALGVILYELLTGRRPFQGEGVLAITTAIALDTPRPLAALVPDLPPALGALVHDCLAKEPARRVRSVVDLARGLFPFGSPEARRSLEAIARLLPEAAVGARGAPLGGVAPQPAREALVSSGGAEAGAQASVTAPVTAWGQTRRMRRAHAVPALLVGGGAVVLGAVTLGAIWMAGGLADAPASNQAHAMDPEGGSEHVEGTALPSRAAVTPAAGAAPGLAPQGVVEEADASVMPAEAQEPNPAEEGDAPAPAPPEPEAPREEMPHEEGPRGEAPRKVEAKKPAKPEGGAARGTPSKSQAGEAPRAKGKPEELLKVWD